MNLEKLADMTDHLTLIGQKRKINAFFLKHDESHLFPINGAFNATKRAIRTIQRSRLDVWGYEYILALDAEISQIVNNVL